MKKKWLVVRSVVLLAACAALLTVASLAWFSPPSTTVKLNLEVTKGLKLDVKVYRVADGGETQLTEGDALVPEELYPGKDAAYRIDIVNRGDACTLSVSLIGIEVTGGLNDLRVAVDGDAGVPFAPDAAGRMTIRRQLQLPAGGAASVAYRYYLGENARPTDTVGTVAVAGLRFASEE